MGIEETYRGEIIRTLTMITVPAGGGCDSFQISETPITVAQWNAVMTEEQREGQENDWPVTRVNVNDCLAFCARMGADFRLPTDREWCWAVGREPENLERYAVYDQDAMCAVKTKLPNEYGLYDMRGLVWEWIGTKGHLRGGSWILNQDDARAVYRYDAHPGGRDGALGFRVVLSVPPLSEAK